ncbi:MAG: hypothetical protein IPK79_06035 [Vampirovibrionales bacterium]|nr:hypothetical protein [Vampirovibrionales bacterium]
MKTRRLLIQGDFKPSRGVRQLRLVCVVLGAAFLVGVCVAIALYGTVVHYETGINRTMKRARQMNEDNRNLQARLNRLQSFQNIQSAAAQAPTLHLPEEVIEVAAPAEPAPFVFSAALLQRPPAPKTYGY